jgi:N-ethylmaleimide reductase
MLFSSYRLGKLELKNRLVMAPMTRSRAPGNIPNDLMATYYGQRAAAAGLIVTEGTAPSPNALGYANIPGIFSPEQIEGWRQTTAAVHARGGLIFVQLMHCGRIAHQDNLPPGAHVVAPSAVLAKGEMFTVAHGMQPHTVPIALTISEIRDAVEEYAQAAKNAVAAGFDGVELHGANGYLIEQFLHPSANHRTDTYGGDIKRRNRFAVDVARSVVKAIGGERVGIRLSPCGVFNDLELHDEIEAQYADLATQLSESGVVYVHLVDHSSMGAPKPASATVAVIRRNFRRTLIASGGYDKARAEADLAAGRCELVAFGRPFLANPDLTERFKRGSALNAADPATFYVPGPKGYTDYPTL